MDIVARGEWRKDGAEQYMGWVGGEETYHSQGSELADLLDRAGCSLLERNTVNLY